MVVSITIQLREEPLMLPMKCLLFKITHTMIDLGCHQRAGNLEILTIPAPIISKSHRFSILITSKQILFTEKTNKDLLIRLFTEILALMLKHKGRLETVKGSQELQLRVKIIIIKVHLLLTIITTSMSYHLILLNRKSQHSSINQWEELPLIKLITRKKHSYLLTK